MKQYLRENQIQEMQREKKFLEDTLADPMSRAPGPGGESLDVGILRKQLSSLTRDLDSQTPHDLNAEERDKVDKRSKELLKQVVNGRQTMPSAAEMRKNPPGAVGKHINWENKVWDAGDGSGKRSNKERVLERKNCQRLLHKGDDDPDIANIEVHRPKSSTLSFDGAQIQGTHYDIPSDQYKQNYDRAMGVTTDDEEVAKLQSEIDELRIQLGKKQETVPEKKSATRKRRKWTEEEKAAASLRFHERKKLKEAAVAAQAD